MCHPRGDHVGTHTRGDNAPGLYGPQVAPWPIMRSGSHVGRP